MAISVKLQVFEGPLDLLLHLIEKNKVDIYDIPISLITEQYLEYIKAMKDEDMDVASEFLVMAATLLDIKCRMLLPKEVNEEGEEEDPRAELVEKLIEYKLYKYMSFELKDRQIDACRNLYKEPSIPDEIKNYVPPLDYDELIGDMDLSKLNNIFKAVMRRRDDKIDPIRSKFGNIEKENVDLEAKQVYVRLYVSTHKTFSFRELLERQNSKPEIVVTFLLILEMIKIGEIEVSQEDTCDDITIVSKIVA
ncbi:MAG: segregation/condensation protein A [Lachnospiraceae bacterium]|nr:segregation/condensation protein A [Lachnospiraceae bacterium]